jgi:F0F1-type ATP synthase membrane subunit b/b'
MPKQVVDEQEKLRELTRAAHEAAKDLRAALTEYRQAAAAIKQDLIEALDAVGEKKLDQWADDWQKALNQAAADLNDSVDKARDHVVHQLTLSDLVPNEDGKTFRISFAGGMFKEDGEVITK